MKLVQKQWRVSPLTNRELIDSNFASPLVSIVVTIFNGESYVADCIASVLAQSYENLEIIIADDNSTDSSLERVLEFSDKRIIVLPKEENRLGVHGNWERAYKAAGGVYLKHVCHDDLLAPECIVYQVGLLESHLEAGLVCGRRRIIDDRGETVIEARGVGSLNESDEVVILSGEQIAKSCVKAATNLLGEPASVLFRRSALPDDLFDTRWTYVIDIELYLRIVRSGFAAIDRRVICSFRVSPSQLSAVLGASQASELRALFIKLRRQYPTSISRYDLIEGYIRSFFHARMRRLFYLWLTIRQRYSGANGPKIRASQSAN